MELKPVLAVAKPESLIGAIRTGRKQHGVLRQIEGIVVPLHDVPHGTERSHHRIFGTRRRRFHRLEAALHQAVLVDPLAMGTGEKLRTQADAQDRLVRIGKAAHQVEQARDIRAGRVVRRRLRTAQHDGAVEAFRIGLEAHRPRAA